MHAHEDEDEIALDEAFARVPILNPAVVTRAAISEKAQNIDTDRLMQAYARQIRATGGEVRTRAQVTALERTGAGWRITVAGQTLDARILVDAAGPWADAIAGLAGLPRRVPDYNMQFADFNFLSSVGAFGFGLSQLLLVYAVVTCCFQRSGPQATEKVWEGAEGLEWTLPSPPPYHSFETPPVVK